MFRSKSVPPKTSAGKKVVDSINETFDDAADAVEEMPSKISNAVGEGAKKTKKHARKVKKRVGSVVRAPIDSFVNESPENHRVTDEDLEVHIPHNRAKSRAKSSRHHVDSDEHNNSEHGGDNLDVHIPHNHHHHRRKHHHKIPASLANRPEWNSDTHIDGYDDVDENGKVIRRGELHTVNGEKARKTQEEINNAWLESLRN